MHQSISDSSRFGDEPSGSNFRIIHRNDQSQAWIVNDTDSLESSPSLIL